MSAIIWFLLLSIKFLMNSFRLAVTLLGVPFVLPPVLGVPFILPISTKFYFGNITIILVLPLRVQTLSEGYPCRCASWPVFQRKDCHLWLLPHLEASRAPFSNYYRGQISCCCDKRQLKAEMGRLLLGCGKNCTLRAKRPFIGSKNGIFDDSTPFITSYCHVMVGFCEALPEYCFSFHAKTVCYRQYHLLLPPLASYRVRRTWWAMR